MNWIKRVGRIGLSGGDKLDGYMRRVYNETRGSRDVRCFIFDLDLAYCTLLNVLSICLSNSISIICWCLLASFFVFVCFDCGSKKKAKKINDEKTDQYQQQRDVLRHRRAVASSLGDHGRGRKRGDIAGFHVAGA